MKKILCLVLSFACLICSIIHSCEVVMANEQTSKEEVVKVLIEQYAKDENADYTINKVYDMRGVSDEENAYTFF